MAWPPCRLPTRDANSVPWQTPGGLLGVHGASIGPYTGGLDPMDEVLQK